jgi:hypothetical protein
MAVTVGVHASTAATANLSLTTAGVVTQAAGSTFVICAIIHSTASVSSIGDNKGNVYTQMGTTIAGNGGSNKLVRYYCQNGAGGSGHTATVTTATAIGPSLFFVELIGAKTSGGPSIANQNQDSTTPYTSPSTGSLAADAGLISIFVGSSENAGTVNAESSGFTVQETITDGVNFWTGALATRIGTAASTYQASWTETTGLSNGPPFCASIDAFDVFVAPVYTPRILLLGVG